jgi:hypothetical protein
MAFNGTAKSSWSSTTVSVAGSHTWTAFWSQEVATRSVPSAAAVNGEVSPPTNDCGSTPSVRPVRPS